mmetsp:Transcript_122709/g.291841  ORF Transcript_122709/g.291841 Transcript_122709/m.291841 type:complete len:254 (+) Transcript_122709:144-905(+)
MDPTHLRRSAACCCSSCAMRSRFTFSSASASSFRPMLRRYLTSSTSSSILQVGHVCRRVSHRLMQSSWKICWQFSVTTGVPYSTMSSAHMTQWPQVLCGAAFNLETKASHAGSAGTSQSWSPSSSAKLNGAETLPPPDAARWRATTFGSTRKRRPPSSGRSSATTVTDSTRNDVAGAELDDGREAPSDSARMAEVGEVTGSRASVTSTPSMAPHTEQHGRSLPSTAVRAPQPWQKSRPSATEAPAPMIRSGQA